MSSPWFSLALAFLLSMVAMVLSPVLWLMRRVGALGERLTLWKESNRS
jgi:uncharacterized protein HemY